MKQNQEQQKSIPEPETRSYPPLTLSVQKMAEEMNISEKTAYWLVHQPGFPAVKVKGRFIINYKRLQDWLDAHSPQARYD